MTSSPTVAGSRVSLSLAPTSPLSRHKHSSLLIGTRLHLDSHVLTDLDALVASTISLPELGAQDRVVALVAAPDVCDVGRASVSEPRIHLRVGPATAVAIPGLGVAVASERPHAVRQHGALALGAVLVVGPAAFRGGGGDAVHDAAV